MKTIRSLRLLIILAVLAAAAGILPAQVPNADPSLLTLDRIFNSRDFAAERFGPARWLKDGETYTTLEASTARAEGATSSSTGPTTANARSSFRPGS